jgi:hypothetical protein
VFVDILSGLGDFFDFVSNTGASFVGLSDCLVFAFEAVFFHRDGGIVLGVVKRSSVVQHSSFVFIIIS